MAVVEDKVCLIETKDGVFSEKSMYKALQPISLMLGRSCVQLKICFFAWEAIWGKILTMD